MDRKNYSKYDSAKGMTYCTLKPTWEEQIFCTCSEMATGEKRCMYYLANIEGACDSFKAQQGENRVTEPKASMGLMEKNIYFTGL